MLHLQSFDSGMFLSFRLLIALIKQCLYLLLVLHIQRLCHGRPSRSDGLRVLAAQCHNLLLMLGLESLDSGFLLGR